MLKILQQIVLILNSTFQIDDLLQKILDLCIQYTPATSGSILLADLESREFHLKASRGKGDPKVLDGFHFRIEEGISGESFRTKHPIYVDDVSQSSIYKALQPGVGSEYAIPLMYQGKIHGILCLDSYDKAAFQQEHLQFFDIVASIASQSLNNVLIYGALKSNSEYSRILVEIGHILTQSLELEPLFQKVMELLAKELQIEIGILTLLSDDRKDLGIAVSWGLTKDEAERGTYRIGEGITGLVVQKGSSLGVQDIRKEKSFLGRTGFIGRLSEKKQYCFICTPLIISNQVSGALSITKAFNGEQEYKAHMHFMELVSATIAKSVYIHLLFNREKQKWEEENQQLKSELQKKYRIGNIIAFSGKMRGVLDKVKTVARSNATVIIRGESGTGKELIAQAIHYNSLRSKGPFIKINCAALPDSLLESELFGYVKGAFTGADKDKPGKFQIAHGGSIFLDEIGDTSPVMQVKLLRVLQEREFEPIGSNHTMKTDVRIIAATNQNLEKLVEKGTFRSDLYYRLNVFPIFLPSLREHKEDIPYLSEFFLKKYTEENGKDIRSFEPKVMSILKDYEWPGNIRELENIIEYACVMEKSNWITIHSLPLGIGKDPSPPGIRQTEEVHSRQDDFLQDQLSSIPIRDNGKLRMILDETEKQLIEIALKKTGGNRSQAARYI